MITDWKAYHRTYWAKRRKAIIDYLGGKCVRCGSDKNLEVDHRDPRKKSFNVSYRCSINTIKSELAKCQLLCRSCHRNKTISEKVPFTHGTIYGWMKKKCFCRLCFSMKRAWHDKRNQKRREATRQQCLHQ